MSLDSSRLSSTPPISFATFWNVGAPAPKPNPKWATLPTWRCTLVTAVSSTSYKVLANSLYKSAFSVSFLNNSMLEGTFHKKWLTLNSIPDRSATTTLYPFGAMRDLRNASDGLGEYGFILGKF